MKNNFNEYLKFHKENGGTDIITKVKTKEHANQILGE